MKRKKLQITENDFFTVNGVKNRDRVRFSIQSINERNFNDDLAAQLENYLNEYEIGADMFNIEYMGFLTGEVKGNVKEINRIVPLINQFLQSI